MNLGNLASGIANYATTMGTHAVESSVDPTWYFRDGNLRTAAQDATNLDPGDVLKNTLPSGAYNTYMNVAPHVIPVVASFFGPIGMAAGAGYAAANNYAHGGSLGSSALAGGTTLAGSYLGGQLGSAIGSTGSAAGDAATQSASDAASNAAGLAGGEAGAHVGLSAGGSSLGSYLNQGIPLASAVAKGLQTPTQPNQGVPFIPQSQPQQNNGMGQTNLVPSLGLSSLGSNLLQRINAQRSGQYAF